MNNYICPPKLNSTFTLAFWSVPELLTCVAMLIFGVYLDYRLIALSIVCVIGFGRFNGDRSMFKMTYLRLLYHFKTKTYRQ